MLPTGPPGALWAWVLWVCLKEGGDLSSSLCPTWWDLPGCDVCGTEVLSALWMDSCVSGERAALWSWRFCGAGVVKSGFPGCGKPP